MRAVTAPSRMPWPRCASRKRTRRSPRRGRTWGRLTRALVIQEAELEQIKAGTAAESGGHAVEAGELLQR